MTIPCTLRCAAVVLVAGCAAAAPFRVAAQPTTTEAPAWHLAESPGAAGFGFGLGIDLGWEELDSLAGAAATTTVTNRDDDGREVTRVIPGDPALDNRKFDFRFEVETAGGQAPIALPRFSLGRSVTVFPSLVIEAAVTDVTFRFDDRTNPENSGSLTARGTSYGLGLESVAALGRSSRWYLAAGYRYRDLPSLELERSPPFDPFASPGQESPAEVTHDEVRLSQESHRATLRVGRAFRDGRFNPYLGLRGRWTELDVEDELDFRSQLGDETALRTRTRYESDSALGVAGVDARLGGPVVGRAEVTFGDGDAALLLKTVVRLNPGTPEPPTAPTPAEVIAREFDRLRKELERKAEELEPQRDARPELYASRVLELLDRIEAEAVAVLVRYDYLALADWLRDRFDEARAAVETGTESRADLRDLRSVPETRPGVRFASLGSPAPQARGNDGAEGREEGWFGTALRALTLIFTRASQDCMDIEVSFRISGVDGDAALCIHLSNLSPRSILDWCQGESITTDEDASKTLRIGRYSYKLDASGGNLQASSCDGNAGGLLEACPLILVTGTKVTLDCDFTTSKKVPCEPRTSSDSCSNP